MIEEILQSMQWDAEVLDDVLANDVLPDFRHAQVLAVRKHLMRYQELLRD